MTTQVKFEMLADRKAGLSYQQIADKYNSPIGTVKSRLNRARLASIEVQENVTEEKV